MPSCAMHKQFNTPIVAFVRHVTTIAPSTDLLEIKVYPKVQLKKVSKCKHERLKLGTIAMQEFIHIICSDFTTLKIGTNRILKNKINMVKTMGVYIYT